MTWFFAALSVPFINAASSFVDKYLVEKRVDDPYVLVFWSGIVATCIGVPLWWFTGFEILPLYETVLLMIAGALTQIGFVFWYMALSKDEVSRLTPIGALFPVATYFFAWLILGEVIPVNANFGFVLLVGAAFIVSYTKKVSGVFRFRPALIYMLAFIVIMSLHSVMFKYVEASTGFMVSYAIETLGAACGAVVLLLVHVVVSRSRIKLAISWGTMMVFVFNDLLYVAGLSVGLYAVTIGPASLTSAVSNIQPFVVLLIGWGLTRFAPHIGQEDMSLVSVWQKGVAATLAVSGTLIVALNAL